MRDSMREGFIQAPSPVGHWCEWSDRWRLKLDPDKCEVLTMALRNKPVVGAQVTGGISLKRIQVTRDLGVLLGQSVKFGDQVEHTV